MADNILIDTSAFYALVSATDEFHNRASTLYSNVLDQRANLYTTSYILVECMALIHRRLGFSILDSFVESVRGVVAVVWIDQSNHWASWDMVKARGGRGLSYVDCTTVMMAKSLNAKVFAFDEDFTREGLEVL